VKIIICESPFLDPVIAHIFDELNDVKVIKVENSVMCLSTMRYSSFYSTRNHNNYILYLLEIVEQLNAYSVNKETANYSRPTGRIWRVHKGNLQNCTHWLRHMCILPSIWSRLTTELLPNGFS
jgi:hypothetical protein